MIDQWIGIQYIVYLGKFPRRSISIFVHRCISNSIHIELFNRFRAPPLGANYHHIESHNLLLTVQWALPSIGNSILNIKMINQQSHN